MKQPDEQLNQLAIAITRAGGISDEDVYEISSSAFLHTRLRARIEAENRKRAEQGSGWLTTLLVASRAIALLVLITAASAAAFWVTLRKSAGDAPINAKVDDLTRVVAASTCALSSTEQCAISTEEVLATMFADQNGKEQK